MITKDEIIVGVYGPSTKNEVPDAARFGGAAVTPGFPGEGATAVIEATNARHEKSEAPAAKHYSQRH